VPHEVAESVLDRLEELGLVDDQVFADMLVRSRTTAKRLSRRALRAELTAKGVATDIIDDVLHQVTDDDERRMAGELVQRRLPAMAHLEPVVRQRRLAALLARKGHSSATIRATLRDYESDLK
jgi:regulatory protein